MTTTVPELNTIFVLKETPEEGKEPIGYPFQEREREVRKDPSSSCCTSSETSLWNPFIFSRMEKQMDVFDELHGYSSQSLHPVPTTSPIQSYNGHQYSVPKNKDAKQIWEECAFGELEGRRTLEHIVGSWALDRAMLQGDNLCWRSGTGITYKTTWHTFLKWFLLCCNKVR